MARYDGYDGTDRSVAVGQKKTKTAPHQLPSTSQHAPSSPHLLIKSAPTHLSPHHNIYPPTHPSPVHSAAPLPADPPGSPVRPAVAVSPLPAPPPDCPTPAVSPAPHPARPVLPTAHLLCSAPPASAPLLLGATRRPASCVPQRFRFSRRRGLRATVARRLSSAHCARRRGRHGPCAVLLSPGGEGRGGKGVGIDGVLNR